MKIETKASKNDKIIIIYHGEDFDGKCSGAIAYNFFNRMLKIPESNITCVPADYSKTVNIEKIRNKIVCILDFSFSPEIMFEIYSNAKEIHWVDHHVHAVDAFEEYRFNTGNYFEIPGKIPRYNTKAACELSWEYFFGVKTPYTVKLLSKFDICGNPYSEDNDINMMSFQYGLRTYCTTDIKSSLWYNILFKGNKVLVSNICKRGSSVLKYEEIIKEERLQYDGIVASLYNEDKTLISDKIFVINKNRPGIIFTYDLRNKYDYVCTYVHDLKKGYRCTIYTSKKNKSASDIASMFGGGGHKEAAGFRCKELPFVVNNSGE